tara:strand:- start:708 stop:1982 length:1275 start_codon:yes stop_codon:yes gene_type:complete
MGMRWIVPNSLKNMKILDQYKPILHVLLNDVILVDKKKNGEPLIINNKHKVMLNRKNDPHFEHIYNKDAVELLKKQAEGLPNYQFNNETYLQLKGLTSEKDMVRKIAFTEINLMKEDKIAIKYIDFTTNTLFVPRMLPLNLPLNVECPYTGELIEIDEVHVDDIHVDDIPIDYIITENEIVIINVKDFQSRRLEKVEQVLKFDSIDKFKSFIKTPESEKLPEKQYIDFNQLNEYGIQYFYHMTHFSNLSSIIENGLLSHNKAHQKNYVKEDISDLGVNYRRNRKELIYNNNLHDYVPLYFNPRNPMLFRRLALEDDIIILTINLAVLESNIFLFTDGNAASNQTNIYSKLKNMNNLDWECINDRYWNKYIDGKRKKCSEMLIYDKVNVEYINAVCCNNIYTNKKVSQLLKHSDINGIINQELFF